MLIRMKLSCELAGCVDPGKRKGLATAPYPLAIPRIVSLERRSGGLLLCKPGREDSARTGPQDVQVSAALPGVLEPAWRGSQRRASERCRTLRTRLLTRGLPPGRLAETSAPSLARVCPLLAEDERHLKVTACKAFFFSNTYLVKARVLDSL